MPQAYDGEELIVDWPLLPAEAVLVGSIRGPARLGFAVLLKFFQREGRFPQRPQDVPPPWWPKARHNILYSCAHGSRPYWPSSVLHTTAGKSAGRLTH
jgi:hypothetical protein